MRLSRDLRKMGDAEDLTAAGFIGAPAVSRSFTPTFQAARPLIPVSISSNTRVSMSSASARTDLMASITRDSSPPEAILAMERGGSPGLADMRNST